jgi:hypothetical protein
MIRAISPIFAVALANIVRKSQGDDDAGDDPDDDGGPLMDDEPRDKGEKENGKKRSDKGDADWWKRGEPPPF